MATKINRRLNLFGFLMVSVLTLAALALPLSPASAQAYVQLGPFAFGVAPPPAYYPPDYYYPYYQAYYPPTYYYYPY